MQFSLFPFQWEEKSSTIKVEEKREEKQMAGYFVDFAIASALIVGITALMGSVSNTIGERLFGRNKREKHVEASRRIQQGWNFVGGKK